jgi:hypothetical protein
MVFSIGESQHLLHATVREQILTMAAGPNNNTILQLHFSNVHSHVRRINQE